MNNKKHIQFFPADLLNKIFSYVNERDMCNTIPFVCEKWKLASSHSLHMKNAYFEGKSLSAKEICFVLCNTPLLESVTLVSCDDMVPILRQISRCNVHVKKLIFKNCSSNGDILPEEVLINTLLSLPELTAIELFNTKFDSNWFFELVTTQKNITSIDLSLNEFISLDDLIKLAHNSHITEFKLSRRLQEPKIMDEEMSHLIRTMSDRLTLLHLDLGGIGSSAYNEILSCSKLVDLKLNNAMDLSAILLKEFPLRLRKVKYLSLEGPTQGLGRGDIYNSLFATTKFGDQLESLKLKKFDLFNNAECCNVIDSCPNLSILSLKRCKYLSFQGIIASMSKLNNLKHLNIAFLGKLPGVINIQELGDLGELVIDDVSLRTTKIIGTNKELKILKI